MDITINPISSSTATMTNMMSVALTKHPTFPFRSQEASCDG